MAKLFRRQYAVGLRVAVAAFEVPSLHPRDVIAVHVNDEVARRKDKPATGVLHVAFPGDV